MRLFLAACIAACVACRPGMDEDERRRLGLLETGIAVLQSRVDELELRAGRAEAALAAVGRRQPDKVDFAPSSAGYRQVATDSGVFLVALDKVTPYANGQKLTFRIGNPQSATFRNPTVAVRWGMPSPAVGGMDGNYAKAYAEWQASLQSKSERLLTDIRPGVWNTVTIVVAPATSEEIGYIEYAMDVGTVSMATR